VFGLEGGSEQRRQAGVHVVTLDQPDQAGHLIARVTTATTLTRHR
jgi:hypothetical protein